MTTLYNCRHDGDVYRITKFDADLNVLATYLTSLTECDCPAGVRPSCRHRAMLPRFLAHEHIGDGWMYDHDRDGWIQMDLQSIMDIMRMSAAGTAAGTAEHQQMPAAGDVTVPTAFSRRGL